MEEVDLHTDLTDLDKLSPSERHLVHRLVAFFATGDTIVANNLVLNLYQHLNAPEARLYLSRQLFEEAVHIQFYEDRRAFLLNLICFAACIEGLFFYGAFAYVYFLRSRGLLHGLASGTNWVFRDESMHMAFAFDVVRTVRAEEPDLVDDAFEAQVRDMLTDAVAAETAFAQDLLRGGIPGMTVTTMRTYLEHVADRRLAHLGFAPIYRSANPFVFLEIQDVQELSNFFERRFSAYQIAISGTVNFDTDF